MRSCYLSLLNGMSYEHVLVRGPPRTDVMMRFDASVISAARLAVTVGGTICGAVRCGFMF